MSKLSYNFDNGAGEDLFFEVEDGPDGPEATITVVDSEGCQEEWALNLDVLHSLKVFCDLAIAKMEGRRDGTIN